MVEENTIGDLKSCKDDIMAYLRADNVVPAELYEDLMRYSLPYYRPPGLFPF